MKVGVLVQARMSSERLPGKVLCEIAGRPLLGWLVEGLRQARAVDAVVLTTSDDPSDEPIARFAAAEGLALHRGPLDDVLGRVAGAARTLGLDAVVRVSGDSPLLLPSLVDAAAERWRAGGVDVVTNVFPRTYPAGQSVELLGIGVLDALDRVVTDPSDREHVTPALYRSPGDLLIHNLVLDPPAPQVRMVVDTPADLDVVGRVLMSVRKPVWEHRVEELIELIELLDAR